MVVVVAVVIAAVVGGLVGALVVRSSSTSASTAAPVVLEPAGSAPADAFTATVAVGAVPEFPADVVAANASMRQGLSADPDTKVLVAVGTTPGLYGGSGDAKVCDPQQLVAFLAQEPGKAAAWAGVFAIAPDGIADFVAKLTPVLLTSDTLVTNHGYRDGAATPFVSVLQAGTAVLVDAQGTPRVKCNCGNPLAPADPVALSDAATQGAEWPGYDAGAVTAVRPGDPGPTLTLIDIHTGVTYPQSVATGRTGGSGGLADGTYTLTGTTTYKTGTTPIPAGSRLVVAGDHASVVFGWPEDTTYEARITSSGGIITISGPYTFDAQGMTTIVPAGTPAVQVFKFELTGTLSSDGQTFTGSGGDEGTNRGWDFTARRVGAGSAPTTSAPTTTAVSPTTRPAAASPTTTAAGSTSAPDCSVAAIQAALDRTASGQRPGPPTCVGVWAQGSVTFTDGVEGAYLFKWNGTAWGHDFSMDVCYDGTLPPGIFCAS